MDRLKCLIASAGGHTCALPLAAEMELMRPLDVEPLPDVPPFVLGMALVRGVPVPVIDLPRLLEAQRENAPHRRWIFSRRNDQALVLAVESVDGVAELDRAALEAAPTFGSRTDDALVSAIALHEQRLFWLLETARIVPAGVWEALRDHTRAQRA